MSSTWTAVAGSLTAGDSARMPMSASSRNANSGSWRKVRSGPVTSPARTAVSVTSPPCRSATGAPCWSVSPMPARSTITAPPAARSSRPRSSCCKIACRYGHRTARCRDGSWAAGRWPGVYGRGYRSSMMPRPCPAIADRVGASWMEAKALTCRAADQGDRGEHRHHLGGRHDHRHFLLVADDQGGGDREHEHPDGEGECPPHDRVVTEQVQPGRQAGEGPLHDQEQQREDDGHQPQDAEAHRDQRLGHPGAGHGGVKGDPGQQQAKPEPGQRA